ncbi:hypothetical protein BpHYR1_050003 [Brachionus plicatilis]|uniref:Uncharacterized protein n=1 Tax=Brachionus plicatilis TaxID=10195 RepID=A0A3M7RFD2_BRAPC|nr:hypothetical protein BpHYR1_050003 [Brachionus plicatilis]
MIPNTAKGKHLHKQIEQVYRQANELVELRSPLCRKLVTDTIKFMRELSKQTFGELKIYDLFNRPFDAQWFGYLNQLWRFKNFLQRFNPARIDRIKNCLKKKRNFLRRYAYDQFGITFEQFESICEQTRLKISHVTFRQNKLDKYLMREG